MLAILTIILFGLSLCADCFAVSLCSSVTVKEVKARQLAVISLSFAVIQTGLLLLGWEFGSLLAGFVHKIAHVIGFLLLLYVGGSMVISFFKNEHEVKDLNGFRNIVIGGIATSIDALAVGISLSMAGQSWAETFPEAVSVFVCTAASVVAGILMGKAVGCKAGRWAELFGGVVLVGIGVSFLI